MEADNSEQSQNDDLPDEVIDLEFRRITRNHRRNCGIREQTDPHAPRYCNEHAPAVLPTKRSFTDRLVRRFFGK